MMALFFVFFAAAGLPYSPSLDLTSVDRSADPCVDFYQFSCGGWMKRNPIPADESFWDVYAKLGRDGVVLLRELLDEAAAAPEPRDAVTQKIGDAYAACMDDKAGNALGATPLQTDLRAVDEMKATAELTPLLVRLQLTAPTLLFPLESAQDMDDSKQVILSLGQGGLGLPDRDYYTKSDPKSVEIREHYRQHVAAILMLLGDETTLAKREADEVVAIEHALAVASLTNVERRDPYKIKNKLTLKGLSKLAPVFDWSFYVKALELPQSTLVNVKSPGFFRALSHELSARPLSAWKSYLRFHIGNNWASSLSDAFVNEDFAFYKHYLRGTETIQPRWKRCVHQVDETLGEALGQAYVKQVFSPHVRESALAMTIRIEAIMQRRLSARPWMSATTKHAALAKLHAIRNKIGYPDVWRDYSSVAITKNNNMENLRSAVRFEVQRTLRKIGKPVDLNEWDMTPPTVNADYDDQHNDINFPAAVLQPPLFDAKLDDAPNYGNTGSTIGHELTHGFDDQGRKYDATGTLRDWWTPHDGKEFERRARCVQEQYAKYVVVDDIHIDSKLTVGEDVADLGGVILAYEAWKEVVATQSQDKRDGFTPEQRFFVGFAQWACVNATPEVLRLNAQTDPHSPGQARINGVVVNMPEFARAFACKAGSPMVKAAKDVCEIW